MNKLFLIVLFLTVSFMVYGIDSGIPEDGLYEILVYPGNMYCSDTNSYEDAVILFRVILNSETQTIHTGMDHNHNWELEDNEMNTLMYSIEGTGYKAMLMAYLGKEQYWFWRNVENDSVNWLIYDMVTKEHMIIPMIWVAGL